MRKPGLIVTTVVAVAILIGLGWWQKERLAWKTAKIAEIEEASLSAPLTSMEDILSAQAAGEPLDFRRVGIPVTPSGYDDYFRVFRAGDGISWEVFAPAESGGETLLLGLQTIADGVELDLALPDRAVGYLRRYDRKALKGGRYSVEENRYYSFNPDLVWSVATGAIPTLYVDTEDGVDDPTELPPRTPDLPNNHFQYMLTWWSFAVILVIISTRLYRRET